ncbi:MAG: T9SS type A sorting domain-containing protein [Candidatus Cloacimonetes bacterium]|nr:T9SS type A sorting domain-containing protein [Candidatus Cloacimonadota bacterium]
MDARIYNIDEYAGSIPSIFAQKVHIEPTYSPDEILSAIKGELSQNYPNPFNPTTTIKFSIENDSKIELSIFNVKGQKIKTLANNQFAQGLHLLIWNGDDEFGKPVSSGVYYYKLNVNGKTEEVKKCLFLK